MTEAFVVFVQSLQLRIRKTYLSAIFTFRIPGINGLEQKYNSGLVPEVYLFPRNEKVNLGLINESAPHARAAFTCMGMHSCSEHLLARQSHCCHLGCSGSKNTATAPNVTPVCVHSPERILP